MPCIPASPGIAHHHVAERIDDVEAIAGAVKGPVQSWHAGDRHRVQRSTDPDRLRCNSSQRRIGLQNRPLLSPSRTRRRRTISLLRATCTCRICRRSCWQTAAQGPVLTMTSVHFRRRSAVGSSRPSTRSARFPAGPAVARSVRHGCPVWPDAIQTSKERRRRRRAMPTVRSPATCCGDPG
jgi:hypothetical protein